MTSNNPDSWLIHSLIVHFGDTDAAGVIHFHNLFRWCHEAWEKSLIKYGLNPKDLFPHYQNNKHLPKIFLPIIHCEADFKSAIYTGDNLNIVLSPKAINEFCFQIETKFIKENNLAAIGLIRHLSIDAKTRQKCLLPETIVRWIESSSINKIHKPV